MLIPLLTILFGIVEFGAVFRDSLSISSATRAGARTASAEPRASTFMEDTLAATTTAATGVKFSNGAEIFIYRARADGLPASGSPSSCTTACNRYVFNSGTWSRSGGSGWDPATQQACAGATVDSVGVSMRNNHQAITGFLPFLNNLNQRERTVMRLEPLESSCSG